MRGPTPAELDDMIEYGLAEAGAWHWRRRWVRLPVQGATIHGRTWWGLPDGDCWRYSVRQARQMRRALQVLLREYEQHFDELLKHLIHP